MLEDILHKRSLTLSMTFTDPDILKQSKFTDHEIKITKHPAFGKLHCQRCLKEDYSLHLSE